MEQTEKSNSQHNVAALPHARAFLIPEASRQKSDMLLMGLTHDMRSPLFALLGYLQLLQKQLEREKAGKTLEFARSAHAAGLRLEHMMTETLDMMRFGHESPSLRLERVSVRMLLERLWGTFQVIAGQKEIRLTLSIKGSEDILLEADPAFLERALENLVGNAIKFSLAGTDVLVTVSLTSPRVLFEIKDHGRGIPPEVQSIIFEPFQQVRSEDCSGGFGLGLAIVRFIARAHGGDIHVASEVGIGTCFSLWVPNQQCGSSLNASIL